MKKKASGFPLAGAGVCIRVERELELDYQAGLDGQMPLGPCLDFPWKWWGVTSEILPGKWLDQIGVLEKSFWLKSKGGRRTS